MTSLSPDSGCMVVLSATVEACVVSTAASGAVGACVVSTTASGASVVPVTASAFVVSGVIESSTFTEVAAALVVLGWDGSVAAPPQDAMRQTASATPNRNRTGGLFQTTDPDAQTRVARVTIR